MLQEAVYNIITDLCGFEGGRICIGQIWGLVKTICLQQKKNLDTAKWWVNWARFSKASTSHKHLG